MVSTIPTRAGFGPYLLSWKIKVEERAKIIYVANFCRVLKKLQQIHKSRAFFSPHWWFPTGFVRFFWHKHVWQMRILHTSRWNFFAKESPPGLMWSVVEAANSDGSMIADDCDMGGVYKELRGDLISLQNWGAAKSFRISLIHAGATGSERITRGLGWPRDSRLTGAELGL